MKNYYHMLGINKTATIEEIKTAHRKLSKKFHPDVNNQDKFFEEMFKEIQEAYEVLSNDDKRHEYDIEYCMFFEDNVDISATNESGDQFTDEEFLEMQIKIYELFSYFICHSVYYVNLDTGLQEYEDKLDLLPKSIAYLYANLFPAEEAERFFNLGINYITEFTEVLPRKYLIRVKDTVLDTRTAASQQNYWETIAFIRLNFSRSFRCALFDALIMLEIIETKVLRECAEGLGIVIEKMCSRSTLAYIENIEKVEKTMKQERSDFAKLKEIKAKAEQKEKEKELEEERKKREKEKEKRKKEEEERNIQKEIERQKRIAEIKATPNYVIELMKKHQIKNNDKTFFTPLNMNERKIDSFLTNINRKLNLSLNKNDIIAYYDTTFFGGGEDGFACTKYVILGLATEKCTIF